MRASRIHRGDTKRFVIPANAGIHLRTAVRSPPWIPAFAGMTISPIPRLHASKEKGQVFAEQHILIEDDRAPRDLPVIPHSPQPILALADENVGLGLDPVAVDQKAAF